MSQGYKFVEYEGWMSFDTFQFEPPPSRLLPDELPLEFSSQFINACIESDIDSLGSYCMGWQL